MSQLTLQNLSSSSTQDIDSITLSKSDLGLTGATHTLDQIIAAIVIKAKVVLTQANFDAEPEQNLYITDGFSSFTTKNDSPYRVDQLTVNLAKADTGATLTPGDY